MRTILNLACLAVGLAGVALSTPAAASAPRGEISVELGALQNSDPSYGRFAHHDTMSSRGIRVGANVTDQLLIVGGWHRVRHGVTLVTPDNQSVRSAFFADQFTLGPKAEFPVFRNRLVPYALTQAMAFRGVMKLDDDPNTRHNPGQVQATALTPGALGMVGVEARTGTERSRVAAAFFLEMGYGWVARGNYDELGSMRPGGMALRSGIGLRF